MAAMARRNSLLDEPLEELLQYRELQKRYDPSDMIEALTKRTDEEIQALSPKEQEERLDFIGVAQDKRNLEHLRNFFEERQDKPFTAPDFAGWLADNIGYSVGSDAADQRNLACDLLAYATILLATHSNQGFIERLQGKPVGRYKIAIVDGNPILEDEEKS